MTVVKEEIPAHVAIIMDGNGRWAKEKGLPRIAGHRVGVERVKQIVTASKDLGIKALTIFAFSNENWKRPKKEVEMLMKYFREFLKKETKEMVKKNVKFMVIGRREGLSDSLVAQIEETEARTERNNALTFVIAANYGGRQEIVDAARKLAGSVSNKQIRLEDIDEKTFGRSLYTGGLPDVDFLIRTSGEMRISNFLLWQLSYAELYFVEKYWPDFGAQDLKDAVLEFGSRRRRFGGI